MNKKPFDWFAFRNETAAKICANLRVSDYYKYDSGAQIARTAVELADELTFQLMGSNHILKLIEEYVQKKKSRG
jgi:hypothetical protein